MKEKMITFVTTLNPEDEKCIEAVNVVIKNFPCFVWEHNAATYIECAEKDFKAIEKILGPWM